MNIPVQLTSFIGREEELAEVVRLLSDSRLVTVTGPGGCGKTRLAVQVSNKIYGLYQDGVWWVDLASLLDPALVTQIIVHTFGLRPAPDQPLMETLLSFVSSKKMLIVLDNCEHLHSASAQVSRRLLTEAPDLSILATSREAMGIEGESLYPLAGLALPISNKEIWQADRSHLDLQTIMDYDAVKLFVERARSISPSFKLTVDNAPAVIEVCRRLDGLPLALELASARANVLTIQDIAARLNDRLSLLTSGERRGFEPRHHTLKAAIDWSYDLLTHDEQKLLNRLAVFATGCSLDTAESICSGGEILPEQMLDLLSSLVDKSLIIAETTHKAPARYRLLETIREYAAEKLYEAGEMTLLRDRHLDLYLARAEEAMPKQFEAYQQLWLNWLEAEHDNLRAALSWALESRRIEAGLRLASALTYFWEIHSYVQEGLSWMERLLDEADDRVSLKVHVDALVFASFQYMLLGNAQAATSHARQAVELAEAAGDANNPTLAFAMDGMASAAKTAGDFQTAFNIAEKNIRIYRKAGPPFYLGMSLLSQGETAIQLGYYEYARELLNESLTLARQDGDKYRQAHSFNSLGDLWRLEHNYTEAASAYESAAVFLKELGAQRDLASLFSNLGYVYLHQGKVERAHRLFCESMTIHQTQQNMPGMTDCLIGFAATAVVGGQPAAGTLLLGAAAAISKLPSASKWRANQMEYDQYLSLAREGLSADDFEEQQEAGHSLSLDQAVEYARQLQFHAEAILSTKEKYGDLTERELEVAALIARGKTNREIAQDLVLSKRTVEKHAANILSKLELANRSQIVRWAINQGLVQTSD
ncbi:MAG: LuxR C-terminal-related transcriptional regulator [Anaerolineales bacterium]